MMDEIPMTGTHFNAAGEMRKVVGVRQCCARSKNCMRYVGIQWTDLRGKVYEGWH